MTAKRTALALIIATFVAIPIWSAKVKATNDKSLTGAWTLTTTIDGVPPFKVLLNCNDDGTLLFSQASLVATPGGTVVYSNGHGAWEKVRSGEFAFKFVGLIHDQNGTFVGTFEVHGTIQVAGMMNTLSADANGCDFYSGGTSFCFDATFDGERIRVGS